MTFRGIRVGPWFSASRLDIAPFLSALLALRDKRLLADGNVYDSDARFRWDYRKHRQPMASAAWQAATGQDAHLRTGTPAFVDPEAGDLHLAEEDSVARGAGVDITAIAKTDFDGHPRRTTRPTAGADVSGQ